jgi:hypothetical protein
MNSDDHRGEGQSLMMCVGISMAIHPSSVFLACCSAALAYTNHSGHLKAAYGLAHPWGNGWGRLSVRRWVIGKRQLGDRPLIAPTNPPLISSHADPLPHSPQSPPSNLPSIWLTCLPPSIFPTSSLLQLGCCLLSLAESCSRR